MSSPSPLPERAAPPDPWFAEELRAHEPALRGYLRQQYPAVDVDDVVQESYLKLLRLRTRRHIASGKAYLFTIARNTAITLFRRRRKLYVETPVNELPEWRVLDGGADAAHAANDQLRLALVADLIDALPGRCREIMRLAVVEGLTPANIAKELGLAEATVRVQIARGVRKCHEELRRKGELT